MSSDASAIAPKRWNLWADVAGVLIVCAVFAALRWVKLNSLVWGDPAMWILQMSRAAGGELAYRDFTWNYPPLTIWFFTFWLRAFGSTFASVQAAVDLLSLAITLFSYWILRSYLPRRLRLPVVLLLAVIGATAQTKFTLFSLLTYSPSLQLATLGVLMMMAGLLELSSRRLNMLLLASGAFISETAKPESLLAALALLALFVILRRASWASTSLLLAACFVPALLGYWFEVSRAGWDDFKAGMSGYGLATLACPWWPTGLGLYGAIASLAEAWLIAAIALLPFRRPRWLLLGALPSAALFLSYYWYINRGVLASAGSWKSKLSEIIPAVLGTSPVLLPVMWVSIVYAGWLFYRLLRGRLDRGQMALLILLVPPVVMSSRSLFGTTLFPFTEVSAVCYGFFILAGPILLWRFVGSQWMVALIVLLYCGLRIVGGYSALLSNARYQALETRSGVVKLYEDDDGSAEIYRYVIANSKPGDTLLDIPDGGGINFAARLPEPTFSTMWIQLRPVLHYQDLDVKLLRASPPAIVIAADAPLYRAEFGYPEKMGCPCPRLVWQPDQRSGEPGYVFPLVRYIQEHYRVERKIGRRLILVPK